MITCHNPNCENYEMNLSAVDYNDWNQCCIDSELEEGVNVVMNGETVRIKSIDPSIYTPPELMTLENFDNPNIRQMNLSMVGKDGKKYLIRDVKSHWQGLTLYIDSGVLVTEEVKP